MSGSPAGPRLARQIHSRRLRRSGCDDPLAVAGSRLSWHGPAGFAGGRPGSEATIQAQCGLMYVHGRDEGVPRRLGLEVASVAAGILATQGSLALAIAARRGRPGYAVRTSVLHAGLLLLSHYFVVATALDDAVPGPPLPCPGPPFRSADGRSFEIEVLDPDRWKAFWTRLGAGEADLGRAWTVFRWRYERARCSLPDGLHDATARLPLATLYAVAAAAGVSLSPVRPYADVLLDPGTAAARVDIRPAGLGEAGGVDVPTGGRDPGPPAPPAGADLPLAGIRVIEATSRIQGPFAGMLLRMLGADVVRVQPPEGDYGRAALSLHRGKTAVSLDLGRAAGRAGLVELVAGADVFLHNWRPGKAAEWGLDAADLTTRNPGLVYAGASGWGDRPVPGDPVGTDFLVQAYVGLGQGLRPQDEAPSPSRVVLSDLFGALVAAEAILAGLYRRERDGCAMEVRPSLLAGAMSLQEHVLDDMAAGAEKDRVDGRPRWRALDRPVAAADATVMVSADDDESFQRACRACGVDPTGAPRPAVEERLAARLGEGPAAMWEERLNDTGVACAVVAEDLAAIPADPRLSDLFEPVGSGGLAPGTPWTFDRP